MCWKIILLRKKTMQQTTTGIFIKCRLTKRTRNIADCCDLQINRSKIDGKIQYPYGVFVFVCICIWGTTEGRLAVNYKTYIW